MEENEKKLSNGDIKAKWAELCSFAQEMGLKLSAQYVSNVATALYYRHGNGKDVNKWLKDVMKLNAVACRNCRVTWATGMAGRDADSQDEARVSAHANGWYVENGVVLCPVCKEK